MQNMDVSIVNMGDMDYFGNVFRAAETEDEFNVVYLGGSITMGCHAQTEEERYVNLSAQWFKDKFPKANYTFFNAGIGSTTSQFGVARAFEHVLSKQPDLVFVEFSVNDDNTPLFMETFESLIRRILNFESVKGIVIINNLFYDDGRSAAGIHDNIGLYYNLPIVNVRNYIWPEILAGNIQANELTADNLHPNTKGHKIIADLIKNMLDKAYDYYLKNGVKSQEKPHLPVPFTSCRYIDATRYQNNNSRPLLNGFVADKHKSEYFSDAFKDGWTAYEKGSTFTFDFTGKILLLQWKKTINKPACIAHAVIDGNEDNPICLDANFDETWGDLCCLTTLSDKLSAGEHTLTVTIDEGHEESPFMIISVITADNK